MLTMLAARGVPPHVSEITLAIYRASRKGEFAAVNPTLENLIGRRPKRIKELLTEKIGSSPTGDGLIVRRDGLDDRIAGSSFRSHYRHHRLYRWWRRNSLTRDRRRR
jgi:hypothetical protein